MRYETQNVSTAATVSQLDKVTEAKRARILETLMRMQKQLCEINKARHRGGTFKRG